MGFGIVVVACFAAALCVTSSSHGLFLDALDDVRPQSGNHLDTNCHNYTAAQLDSSHCTSHMRAEDGRRHGNFTDLLVLMRDAENQENKHDFVVYATIFMYQHIHCASDAQAVADLFYGIPPEHMPPSGSDWWAQAYNRLHPFTGGPIGRRRRRSPAPEDGILLLRLIADVADRMSPACVQWLIEHFLGTSKHYFLTQNHHFPDPNPYTRTPPPPTTTTSPTTTTTTTSAPTTASTTTTSTPTTTTSTTATTITTASPSSSTTSMKTSTLGPRPVPVTCMVCSGLECLIKTEAEMSHQCDGGVCMVHMKEDTHLGRTIARSCGTWETCQRKKEDNSALCTDVETKKLDWDSECFFCCNENNCNRPPLIMPSSGLWKPPSFSLDG